MKAKIPSQCPSCDHSLQVTELKCPGCSTRVNGDYSMPIFNYLSPEEQTFILDFFKESGKLNTMAKQHKMSYPTMRNKLDDLINKLKKMENEPDQHD